MKSKKPTTKASGSTLVITKPEAILDSHLGPAIKPFARQLREAAALDARLSAEMEAIHPDRIKLNAEELFEKATHGDVKAEKTLRENGGKSGMVREQSAMFCLAKHKHEAHCKATAPLWAAVSEAVQTSLDLAAHDIEEQLKLVLLELGELPSSTGSLWEGRLRGLKAGLQRCERLAKDANHGADWQLKALGLERFITE